MPSNPGHGRTAHRPSKAERRYPPTGEFTSAAGLHTHYVRCGAGPTVVLLHGAGGSVYDYQPSMDLLVRQGFEVIGVDRPGHGYTEEPRAERATPAFQARWLHELLCTLKADKPVLVGHSWGATVALASAIRYSDELTGLVIVAGVAFAEGYNPGSLNRAIVSPLTRPLVFAVTSSPLGRRLGRSMLQEAYEPDPSPSDGGPMLALGLRRAQLLANARQVLTTQGELAVESARYGEIAVPTVILTGDHDIPKARADCERLHGAIPHSRLVTLEKTGHMIPTTRPEDLLAAVQAVAAAT